MWLVLVPSLQLWHLEIKHYFPVSCYNYKAVKFHTMYCYKCHSQSVHQKNLEQAWVEVFSLEFLLPVDDCCCYPKRKLHRSQKQWEHHPFECCQGWHMFLSSLMPFDKPIKKKYFLHSIFSFISL